MMTRAINPAFRSNVDELLDSMIAILYEEAPASRYLAASATIDRELFKRHTVETILRIRLARIADAKAIHHFARTDPVQAQRWSGYAEEGMLHDRLFLKDLKSLGMREEEVYSTEPMLATRLLQGYLYYTLEHEGPRALVTKSYFVEYTSRKTQGTWNENVSRSLGKEAVKGAQAHLHYDVSADHATEVWNVLMSMVGTPRDEARVIHHLRACYKLLVAYFQELAAAFPALLPLAPASAAVPFDSAAS